ncbi:hypothetical protein ABWH88_04450 [Marinobacter adhaerens]|jgi:hypothetical protein|uniref:hypothetical protein n=1 Tax=Marinobacter TaxID=2742 RepID=UPI001C5E3838|nr:MULTISPECIES: hypothetical protein [Marinobacter]MBW4979747.1 hypothetical protein [Marinobacter adhaerens]MBY6073097.1 hypothetical protein [Marinobacter salsuginis]MDC8456087.1 hypothetical protein [Marinobacter sp. DS40M6]MDM8179018.1 hypothetical protein [Marinobacter salarius]
MPFQTKMFPLIVSTLAIGLISGCASTGITEAEPDHSRAWNLTHSVGMTDLEDAEVPKDQIPSGLGTATGLAIDVAYFMNSSTLAMSFGDAFGLGLLGALTTTNKSHAERSSVIAWVPQDQVEGPETVNIWLGNEIKDATMTAMNELGIEGEPEFHNELTDNFFNGTFTETKISGVKADGTECGAYFKVYPEQVSELKTIPDFIAPNKKGYQVFAGDEMEYPRFSAYCLSDTSLDQYVEFVSAISKHLPDTVYFYTRQLELADQTIPPVVYDHGQALLFLTAEN